MYNKRSQKTQRVRIAPVLVRFTFAEPTTRRELTPSVKVIENHFGRITVKMTQKLIARDMKVFVALATYIYENMSQVGEADVNGKRLFAVELDLYWFVKKYLHKEPSKLIYNAVIESLTVLSQTHLEGEHIVRSSSGEEERRQVKTSILPYVEITSKREKAQRGNKEKHTIHVFVFEWVIKMLSSQYPSSLTVDNYVLQQTGTSVATLLCLFLMTQSGATSYSKSFLVEQLGLEALGEDRNVMRELKNAFQDLQDIGYITSWHIEKRKDDIYFIFSRKQKALKDKN